ncbi:AAA family ATPase [Stutzerimonas kunmingensis]|uniref:AAA family ATPase n=2 Tax=Stutzerimonas kunmingensis TaxID=1211807 RepID=UPI002898955E|nr:AAA family ATPase [Stutzerimonas kunmingensis]
MKVLVLTGPESSGKSWLAQRLLTTFGGAMVGEYVRYYIEQTQRDTTLADIPAIARGQLDWEDAARIQAPHLLILDTHLLSNMLWSRTLFGDCPTWLEDELLGRDYHQHLLLSPEGIEWHGDGQRCQPDLSERMDFFQACRSWLVQRDQPFVEVSGGWTERERQAIAHTRALLGE